MHFNEHALPRAFDLTEGYPYFIQELGYQVWVVADGDVITLEDVEDVEDAKDAYEAKLDSSFFRVRLDRATKLQIAYMRGMAQLGPKSQKAADVAANQPSSLPHDPNSSTSGCLIPPPTAMQALPCPTSPGSCSGHYPSWTSPRCRKDGQKEGDTRVVDGVFDAGMAGDEKSTNPVSVGCVVQTPALRRSASIIMKNWAR